MLAGKGKRQSFCLLFIIFLTYLTLICLYYGFSSWFLFDLIKRYIGWFYQGIHAHMMSSWINYSAFWFLMTNFLLLDRHQKKKGGDTNPDCMHNAVSPTQTQVQLIHAHRSAPTLRHWDRRPRQHAFRWAVHSSTRTREVGAEAGSGGSGGEDDDDEGR